MGTCMSVPVELGPKRGPVLKSGANSAEQKKDEALKHIATRMVGNGVLKQSTLHTMQGRKGINQDAMLVWEEFMADEDSVFCGVFDGHGPVGHLVAKRVRDSLPSRLVETFCQLLVAQDEEEDSIEEEEEKSKTLQEEEKENKSADDDGLEGGGNGDSSSKWCSEEKVGAEEVVKKKVKKNKVAVEGGEKWIQSWRDAHLTSYKAMDDELRRHPSIDCFCSGTTSVTVVKSKGHLLTAHVGDSRCVIARQKVGGRLEAVQLTEDLKPSLPAEEKRIIQCRGRVFALGDEPYVSRVWLPYEDSPGLAMARAFGDLCLKEYGVIALPEFHHMKLTEEDKFVVLATDGVWDVLSNQEVVDLVNSTPRDRAAQMLVERAHALWRTKFPKSKADDCAAVCLFLNDRHGNKVVSSGATKSDNAEAWMDEAEPLSPGDSVHMGSKAYYAQKRGSDGDDELAESPDAVHNAQELLKHMADLSPGDTVHAGGHVKQLPRSKTFAKEIIQLRPPQQEDDSTSSPIGSPASTGAGSDSAGMSPPTPPRRA